MKLAKTKKEVNAATFKERAKELRHDAYARAKEFRATDPHQIAMKEKLRAQHREAYQRAKERNKKYKDAIKASEGAKSAHKRASS
jgi:hypothetical protein